MWRGEKGEIYGCQQVVAGEKNLTIELKKGIKGLNICFPRSSCWCILFLSMRTLVCLMYTFNKHMALT